MIAEADKADYFRLADVFAMPGRGEGFGFVFLEALACGVPAVGSRLDGSREAQRIASRPVAATPVRVMGPTGFPSSRSARARIGHRASDR